MSLEKTKEIVEAFLQTDTPGILCIKGKWGVGKTYAWKNGEFGCKKEEHTYISLFGLNSLSQLRSEIIARTSVGTGAGIVGGLIKIANQIATKFTGVNLEKILTPTLFSQIKEKKICFDDLERTGKELSARDVLGLACQLRDEKQCKIVFLLNDEGMAGEDAKDFATHIEKIVDKIVGFAPTPEETADIALRNSGLSKEIQLAIREQCNKYNIVNIRTINRIVNLTDYFKQELKKLEEVSDKNAEIILQKVVHFIAILTCVKYHPQEWPDISVFEFGDIYFSTMADEEFGKKRDKYKKELEDKELTPEYWWTYWNSLGEHIWYLAGNGWFHIEKIKPYIQKIMQRQITENERLKITSPPWNLYHNSFDNNTKEFTEALELTLKKHPKQHSCMDINAIVRTLKKLEYEEKAKELLDFWASKQPQTREFWKLDNFFGGEIDTDVGKLYEDMAKKLKSMQEYDPVELLKKIGECGFLEADDTEEVSKLTIEDFVQIFKKLRKNNDERYFGSFKNILMIQAPSTGNPGHSIADTAEAALDKIAKESLINKARVKLILEHRGIL